MESNNGFTIRMAELTDIDSFIPHVAEQLAESGKAGAPIFSVLTTINQDEFRQKTLERWARPLAEPNWGRTWIVCEPANSLIVGYLELRGGRTLQELHRASLSMGLKSIYTGRGLGRELVKTVISWSEEQIQLIWLDLSVFENNEPAKKLYAKLGFTQVGYREDAFQFESGETVNEIQMSLRLRTNKDTRQL